MAASSPARDTPAMQQYYRFKRRHPDCVLLFRIGDFYEMFDDDAVKVSRAIGLTLTQRTEGIPMAGVPFHQLENYLRRLLAAGFRVAVCDQVQDAAEARGVVDRAVTRVVTPGTLVDDSLLDEGVSGRLAAVAFVEAGDRPHAAAAVADLSSGSFVIFDCPYDSLADELVRRSVTEVLYADTATNVAPPRARALLDALGLAGTARPAWQFRAAESREALLEQYGVATLAGFDLEDDDLALGAAGAVVRYLRETQAPRAADGAAGSPAGATPEAGRAAVLAHLAPPKREDPADTLVIDATTLRALEVLRTLRTGEVAGSLLGVFSGAAGEGGCRTAMGKRLLRDWLCRPPATLGVIRSRQAAVATLVEGRRSAEALGDALAGVQDVTRIAARLALGRASPRDLVALGRSLGRLRAMADAVAGAPTLAGHAARLADAAGEITPLAERIAGQCVDSPPGHLRDGGLFRDGIDAELDEARLLQRDASSWLAQYQKRLLDEHRLPGLKVGYNRVFGYYIELPRAQARAAPASFARRQTLTNAERFITPELKEFEERVTGADARALAREQAMFAALCADAATCLPAIAAFAAVCAELDVLLAFADKAARRGWVRPEVVEEPVLDIEQGRHPVLDEVLAGNFVPNDARLGLAATERSDVPRVNGAGERETGGGGEGGGARLALITGPNMAGKSTYIRQAALLVLLAHTGSFVPARRAVVGIADRIFTRVGADDALHAGQSTFMVEMTETARILHHATARSLVILDEIGRGTSTLDGLALAWAIAETLAERRRRADPSTGPRRVLDEGGGVPPPPRAEATSPRTLFATHYHELTDLEDLLPGRVMNLHVAVREWGESIVFLHRILPGRTSQSYGIHVARLAGIPDRTVRRARQVLESLAVHHHGGVSGGPASPRAVGQAGNGSARPSATGGTGRRGAIGNDGGAGGQMSLFTEYLDHPAVHALREIKLDSLSPLEAFDRLRQLKSMTDPTAGVDDAGARNSDSP
jgi:DNA mismatch repair protein MutS